MSAPLSSSRECAATMQFVVNFWFALFGVIQEGGETVSPMPDSLAPSTRAQNGAQMAVLLTKLGPICIVTVRGEQGKCAAACATGLPRWARFLFSGEVSEWSKEAVLKTVEPLRGSGGSNPSLSGHASLVQGILDQERCESGRIGRPAKALYLVTGTEGSNPSLSVACAHSSAWIEH